MKLFEYKPTEYVDVHPDLPLEWMQQEIDKTQTRYDNKLASVNELNKQFADMKAGAQTQEELQAINDEYSKKINDMVSGLTNTGYIPQTSADLAKFINEVSFDPRVKQIRDDREAYEIYQKNKLDPQYAGGVDMMDYYKPGMPYDPNHYKIIPASDSVAKSRTVAQTMHPSTIDGGKTWTVKDPFTGQTVTRNSYEDAVGVSKERIKAYTDYNYINWKTDPDSYADRVQLSGNDMAFWDTPEGKAIYDEKMRALEPLAYQTDASGKTGTQGTGTKAPTGPKEEKDPMPKSIPKAQTYGDRDGVGRNHEDKPMNNYYTVDKESKYHDDQITILEDTYSNLIRSGLSDSDPRVLEASKRLKEFIDESNIHEDRRRVIEGDYYGKDWEADIQMVLDNNPKLKEAHDDIEALRNEDTTHEFNNPALAQFVGQPGGTFVTGGFIDAYNEELGKKLKENGSKAGEVLKAYEDYANYSTTGISYIVPEDSKYLVGDLIKGLLNDNVVAKDILSDLEMNGEKQKRLFASILNKETGKYDFDRLSPAINLDDKDGPVLTLSGLLDGDEHVTLEYKLEDTPKIRKTLREIVPEEELPNLDQYVEATQSLKASGSKKGEFAIDRYDNTRDTIKFTKVALGKAKWGYKDSKGGIHSSISDLITESTAVAVILDNKMQKLHESLLLEQELIAKGSGDPARAAEIESQLTKIVHADRITRELNPITGKPMTTEDREKYITRKEPVKNPEKTVIPKAETTTSSSGKQQPQTQSNSLGW
jgi:hypothetical protein